MSSRRSEGIQSADGTRIAFDRSGHGPPVILVEAAGHYRDLSSFNGLVPLLSTEFTVYKYDRRGRGESADTVPYTTDREVDDLSALIQAAGGSAHVYAYSSGALLALRAAAHGLPITSLAVLEPPLQDDPVLHAESGLTRELAALVGAGRLSEAVEHFHESIGVPAEVIAEMKSTPLWAKMTSVAHTLVYDCMISDATTPAWLGAVRVSTLVIDSEGSTDNLTGWAARVAGYVPHARHLSLPGEWHTVPDEMLAPVLVDFFSEGVATAPRDASTQPIPR